MINLVPPKESNNEGLARVRKAVLVTTTIVTVIYIVGVGAFLGWKWYWFKKADAVSAELNTALLRVREKAAAEVMVKQTASRVVAVNDFFKKRDPVDQHTRNFTGNEAEVINWEYEYTGKQKVTVQAESVEEGNKWVEVIKQTYNNVIVEEATWENNKKWQVTVSFMGLKNK